MSGKAANDSGKTFEFVVGSVLMSQRVGFERQYRTGIIGEYDEEITVDFFIREAVGFPLGLYLECRWQNSAGSIDKKTSALKDNILHHYDRPTLVVCGGAAIESTYLVLRGAALIDGGNLAGVYRLEDFVAFAPKLGNGDGAAVLKMQFNPDQQHLFAVW